jgi:hypothetical protein
MEFYEPLDRFSFNVIIDTLIYDAYIYYLDILELIKRAKRTIVQLFRDFLAHRASVPDNVGYIKKLWLKIRFKYERIQDSLVELDDLIHRGTLTQSDIIHKLQELNVRFEKNIPPERILTFRNIYFEIFYEDFRPVPKLFPNINDSYSLSNIKRIQEQAIVEQKDEQYELSQGELVLSPERLDERYRKWNKYIEDLDEFLNELYTYQLLTTKEHAQEILSRKIADQIIQTFPSAFQWGDFKCKTDDFSQEGEQDIQCIICDQHIEIDEPMMQSECCETCMHRNCVFQWLYLFYFKNQERPGEKWPDCPGCRNSMIMFWVKNDA